MFGEALKAYKTANPEQKHDAIQRYALNKNITSWVSCWTKSITESREVKNDLVQGWMTEFSS